MRWVLCSLLLITTSATSWAQQSQPAPDDEARKHYEEGKKAYRLGDYDKAIDEWKAGYELKADPVFLYNLGQVEKEKGDLPKALHFYESYLKEAPNAQNVDAVQQRIDELKAEIAKGGAPPPPTSQPAQPPMPPPPPPPPPGSTPTEKSGGGGLKIGGIATGGVGVVLVVTGAIFGASAKSNESAINDARAAGEPWTTDLQHKADSGKTDATLATVCFVVGGAAIAGGGVLFFLGMHAKSEPAVSLIPTVAPGAAALTFAGRF
jgi:tetratricopeptide (TPR) repeat protein